MSLSTILIIYLLVIFETRYVNCCSVSPMTAAVDAGERISLTCLAETGASIDSWRLGSDATNAVRVFTNIARDPNTGNITRNISVAGGYSANTISGQVVLTLNSATTSQANCYYCVCTGSEIPNPFACVSVVASEPSFSATSTTVTDGSPVVFNCDISFMGIANVSMTITDVQGNILNMTQDALNIQGFHNQSLGYSTVADATMNQTYFCNVILSNGTSNTALYSRVLAASLQWTSVRNVQISASDSSKCVRNGECAVNQTVYCTAQGNPTPDSFQWIISINGSSITTENNKNYTRLMYIGYYEIQCTAFNSIQNVRYNASGSFKTNVTVAGPPAPVTSASNDDPNNVAKIAAPVVICGVIIIVLVIIGVIFIIKKQQKNKTFCCDQESRKAGDTNTQSTETKEFSKKASTNGKKSTENGITGTNNQGYVSNANDETTLVENDLYSKYPQNTHVETAA